MRQSLTFLSVTSQRDDVQGFDTKWDEVVLSFRDMTSNDTQESLHMMRIRESDQPKGMAPSHQKLKTIVQQILDQETTTRNLRPETKGLSQEHRLKAEAEGDRSA